MASVDRIAKEKGITPEEVIMQGLDEPGVSLAYGAGATAVFTELKENDNAS